VNSRSDTPSAALLAYRFGDFRLDLRRRLLFSGTNAEPLALTPRVLDTLVFLIQHRGTLLNRETLMDSIWPDADVEPNNLSQSIAKLRRLLGERPGENHFIETVPGRGYRFIAEVHPEPPPGHTERVVRSASEEASVLFRQGLRLLQRPTAANYRLAVERLEGALKLDAGFALAWAWLADAHLLAVNTGLASVDRLDDAARLAQHALTLDPRMGTAHAILGTVHAQRWDWLTAESHCLTAISLDRADAMARGLHASFVLQQVGHKRRALAQLQEALSLAPDDPRMLMNLAMSHCIAGHDDEAVRCARLAIGFGFPESTAPLPYVFAFHAAREGHYAEAGSYAVQLMPAEAGADDVVRHVYAAFADPGGRKQAIAMVREMLDRSLPTLASTSGLTPLLLVWLARLDRLDLAFEVANRSVDVCARRGVRSPGWQALWLPELEELRRDVRFGELAGRIGFPQYWQTLGPPDP
jgi:DNA-binding winged helix-turn-helix (wHTH) protein